MPINAKSEEAELNVSEFDIGNYFVNDDINDVKNTIT